MCQSHLLFLTQFNFHVYVIIQCMTNYLSVQCILLLLTCHHILAEFEPLTCVGCEAGYYLNQTSKLCVLCPYASTTFSYTNASDISDCICTFGFTPTDSNCIECSIGTYKTSISNDSCVVCQDNASTNTTTSISQSACLCNSGYTPDLSDETCEPCAPGTFKSVLSDDACNVCPANTYCTGANIVPEACVENSASLVHSVQLSDCTCNAGYFLTSTVTEYACTPCPPGTYNAQSNQTVCVECAENTYNPLTAQLECAYRCDVNAYAPPGSSSVEECKCNLGFAGEPGNTCIACEPGTFRENSSEYFCELCPSHTYNVDYAATSHAMCVSCQANTESGEGSGSQLACVCTAGFFGTVQYNDEGMAYYECTSCEAGKFQSSVNSSSCNDCAAGKFSVTTAATSAETCANCASGSYNVNTGATQCDLCPENTWQNLAMPLYAAQPCSQCPQNSSHSLLGSYSVHDCVCSPGFDKELYADVFVCELCKAGNFCPENGTMLPCPTNFFSELGVTITCTECAEFSQAVIEGPLQSASSCVCIAGAQGSFHTSCTPCNVGYFQAFDYTYDGQHNVEGFAYATNTECLPCPNATYQENIGASTCTLCPNVTDSQVHSTNVLDCICKAGHYGPDGGPCVQCPENFYCPGGSLLTSCMLHAISPVGSTNIHDCKCLPGYYALSSGLACQKCPPGFYCAGGTHKQVCAANSSSFTGSNTIDDCICIDGMWRGCIETDAGMQNENGSCVIDYTLPCHPCDENVICVNNTVQHCPVHSTSHKLSSQPLDCVCHNGFVAEYANDVHHEFVSHDAIESHSHD
jgi:hypothetical protein